MIDFRNLRPLLVLVLGAASLHAAPGEGGAASEPSSPAATAPASTPAPAGRLVLLGFDGADERTIRELMQARPQDFPNIARLAQEGTFAPLEVVVPPESPVSWASINTGQNPAKTAVPGFVRRIFDFGPPSPGLGHLKDAKIPIEECPNLPIPAWSAGTLGALVGGGLFVIGGGLAFLLLRRWIVALVVGLLLGGGGGYWAVQMRGYLPRVVPCTRNPNQARNLWDYAADAGVPSVILDAAQAFCMDAPQGAQVLAGLGVPDARNGIGDWFVYTTDATLATREGKTSTTAGTLFLVEDRADKIETKLYGPQNFWQIERLKDEQERVKTQLSSGHLSSEESLRLSTRKQELETELNPQRDPLRKATGLRTTIDMTIQREPGAARVKIGGQEQLVKLGDWSEFYELTFVMNPLLEVHALTRVRLISLEPQFELLVNVFDIDPRQPPFWQPISSPPGFSAELAKESGLFETYGWPTLTMPVKDRVIDPELLLEDVEFTEGWREKLTQAALGRSDWKLLMSVFSTADRVQHMLYRYYDPEHPLYEAERAAKTVRFFGQETRLADAIPAIYRQMDRIIGEVRARLAPEDVLIVCSDHGFQTFHRQVSLNNWLAEQGYLALVPSPPSNGALLFVDWTRTKAYALGMGFVYLNLQGRERNGIVSPADADGLLREIRAKLLASTDPDNGAHYCKQVYVTKEIHQGPHLDLEADLIVGFAPPYRVSWSTTGGGIGLTGGKVGPVCSDNDSPWSGDHISIALEDVMGVFLSNRRFVIPPGGVKSLHIAPTALALLGVKKPPEMDLAPLELAK